MKHTHSQTNHLVVIRISDSSAIKDLDKKTVETADMHPGIPGVKTLRKLRGTPLRDPAKVNGRVTTCPGFRAVYFRLPGTSTYVLMALGSATMVNLGEDDNAFVTLLADVLSETPVNSVWVADFSRLLRSVDYFSHTWRAVRDHCDFVRHAGAVIDTTSAAAEIQFLFEALSSAAEARYVVQRTTRGKMRAYVDGKCPFRNQSVPIGWTRNDARELQLDPSVTRESVQTIVQVLGDPELTNQQRVERVAETGLTSRARGRRLGRAVPINELKNPATTVARWYGLLDVWRTGVWVVDHDLPTLLNQTRFDYDIELHSDERGTRVWRMRFDLPSPDDGWATDEEFEAAAKLRDRRSLHETPQGGGAAGSARKPFCGMPSWTHDGDQYKLLSRSEGSYELRKRPEEEATRLEVVGGSTRRVANGWGRGANKAGEVVAHFAAEELHRTIADGLVDAATRGLTLRTAADQLLRHDGELVDDLRSQLSMARTSERNARRSANEAASDHERRAYQQDARDAARRAEQLERDLLAYVGPTGDAELPVDAEAVAIALAAVADQDDYVDGEVADALREVTTDFSIIPVDQDTAAWSASLRVPLAGGVLKLGPATGRLDVGAARLLAARRTRSLADRAGEATRLFMTQGLTLEETSAELKITTTRRVAQVIRDHLKATGAPDPAAKALVAWTPATARSIVWARLNGKPFPPDVDQAFAAHVAATYLQADVRGNASIESSAKKPRATVDAVLARGGWVPTADLDVLCAEADISRTTLDYYVDGRAQRGRRVPTYLRRVDDGVGVIRCPHCHSGSATVVNLLPEVTRELLCAECRRMPSQADRAVRFPPEYLET